MYPDMFILIYIFIYLYIYICAFGRLLKRFTGTICSTHLCMYICTRSTSFYLSVVRFDLSDAIPMEANLEMTML